MSALVLENLQNNMTEINIGNQTNVKANIGPEVWPIESREHLIQVKKKSLCGKLPSKFKNYSLIILTIIIVVLIFIIAVLTQEKKTLCTTPQCIRSANNFLYSMNPSADPCNNFYNFACENWRNEHIMEQPRYENNWFLDRLRLINRDILEFLEQEDSEDEPEPVHQARIIYRSCLDSDAMEENGLDALWSILNKIGLPKLPFVNKTESQPWIKSLAKTKRYLTLDTIIGFSVMTSLKNSSVNQLAISKKADNERFLRKWKWGDYTLERILHKKLESGGDSDTVLVWKYFTKQIFSFLARSLNITTNSKVLKETSAKLYEMTEAIANLSKTEGVSGPIVDDIPDEMTLVQLQALVDEASDNKTSKIIWKDYFEYIFEDLNITLDFERKDRILVYKKPYFELLTKYLDTLTEYEIELLIWWEVVYALVPHVNEHLKRLKDDYTADIYVQLPAKPRLSECAVTVYNFMSVAVSYLVISKYDEELKKKIIEMIENIQSSFSKDIQKLQWMNPATKEAIIYKMEHIKPFVAIPDWMFHKEEIEESYANLSVNESTYLENLMSALLIETTEAYANLRIINDHDNEVELDPLDINAFYDASGNTITIPNAILQFPFYDLGLDVLNYGAIGSILGHEVTHSLDSYGRRFDVNGNLKKWWSNKDVREYENRTKCFVDDYSKLFIPSINQTVNGSMTLSENLADEGGLRNSYYAYKNHKMKEGHQPKLPGLEHYSYDQLFFLSFANIWCSESTDESLSQTVTNDEHSPQFVRVNKVLQNSEEFAKAWNCPKGSEMNPTKKCKLWKD